MEHTYTDARRRGPEVFLMDGVRAGLAMLAGLLFSLGIQAQEAGDLDVSFGVGGKVVTDISGDNDEGEAVALQPDGRIILAGYIANPSNGLVDLAVARYLSSGAPDPSFGQDGVVTTSFGAVYVLAHAVALQPDGKIVVGGYTVNPSTGHVDLALARYLADGSLDTSFSSDGKLTMDADGAQIYAVLLQPDGKIVAAGNNVIARYQADGSLDVSFGSGGIATTDVSVMAAELQPDGKIVVAGEVFNSSSGHREFALARYVANGALDVTFGVDGRVDTDLGGDGFARALALQADGKIVAAGDVINASSGHADFALARYLPSGALDGEFDGDGLVTTDFGATSQAFDVILQPDGKVVAAGYAIGVFALARYLPNGSLDFTFNGDGLVSTSFGAGDASLIKGLVIQPDGRLVAGGKSTVTGEGGFDFALARYESGLTPPIGPPTDKAQCKHGGWRQFNVPRAFSNQGDCIRFVNTRK